MSETLNEIDLEYVTIRYEKPVVYLKFKEGAELGFPQVRELTAYAEKLSQYTPYVVFSDVCANMNVTPEGRRVAADITEAPLNRGSAVLVKNEMMKLAANFFNGFKKPVYPFKAFTDRQKALDWLLDLRLE